MLLADALDRAQPDQLIAMVSLADGADAAVWRTTAALSSRRAPVSVASQSATGGRVSYSAFLTWRGFLEREPPRRPDPERPAAPPSFRREAWKFGFTGSRCQACGTRHLPPHRVCVKCQAVDRMTPERMADVARQLEADGCTVEVLGPPEMAALGMEPFRARQLWHWIYHRGVTDFAAMSNLAKTFRERCQNYRPVERVDRAPWQERVVEGDAVDLTKLPIPVHFAVDAAPYITAGQICARDP